MISADLFRQCSLSLPEADEAPHFEATAFRIKKKIFATLNEAQHRATLKFSPAFQDLFCSISKGAMYKVPNKWGNHGWTHINLETAEWALCEDALRTAWWEVASKTIRLKYPELNPQAI